MSTVTRALEKYADDRGIELTPRERRALREGLIDDAYTESITRKPWHEPESEDLPVLRRRTAQERLDDMTKVLVDEYRRTGIIADSILREIQGLYWLKGQNDVSLESLRSIAAIYLNKAARMGQTNDPSVKHDIRTKEK